MDEPGSLLDHDADAIALAHRGTAQVTVALAEARTLRPFLPGDTERRHRLWGAIFSVDICSNLRCDPLPTTMLR
jgi:hypothetical protein